MSELLQPLPDASADINHQLLNKLALSWAITTCADSATETLGIPHGKIYATPLEGHLTSLSQEHLRTAVAQEVGVDVVARCCVIDFEEIDDSEEPGGNESRLYITYTGPAESMPRIYAGLWAATIDHVTTPTPIGHITAS
jgi:hypothetical protein